MHTSHKATVLTIRQWFDTDGIIINNAFHSLYANALLRIDWIKVRRSLQSTIDANQYRFIVLFIFNVGPNSNSGNFTSSSILSPKPDFVSSPGCLLLKDQSSLNVQ